MPKGKKSGGLPAKQALKTVGQKNQIEKKMPTGKDISPKKTSK